MTNYLNYQHAHRHHVRVERLVKDDVDIFACPDDESKQAEELDESVFLANINECFRRMKVKSLRVEG